MKHEAGSRTQRRAGTKTIVMPHAKPVAQGKNGPLEKFRLGRYGRPGRGRLRAKKTP